MKNQLARLLEHRLPADPDAVFLTADLGFGCLEGLRERMGRRFFNVGVAEQNLVGVASGLALQGFTPWLYTAASFLSCRAFEQIRNDICFHGLRARLIGNGGGYAYGVNGSTHHALEDLGLMKTLPGMELFFPAFPRELPETLTRIDACAGPTYLRLSPEQADPVFAPIARDPESLTAAYATPANARLTLACVGQATAIALELLRDAPGAFDSIELLSLTRYNRSPDTLLSESARRTGAVLFFEEHQREGSISESVACTLGVRARILAADRRALQPAGSRAFLLRKAGLDAAGLKQALESGAP